MTTLSISGLGRISHPITTNAMQHLLQLRIREDGEDSGHHLRADMRAAFRWSSQILTLVNLQALPGVNLVNFDTGRVKPRYVFGWSGGIDLLHKDRFTVGAQLAVQNLANRDFAFNWGNPFSGTHFWISASRGGKFEIFVQKITVHRCSVSVS